ncbi:MAG: biopolymer transporter ExbD [Bdellovibrionaceae bacterium]|nr:biopolymer transporter ExbD [Pseudobdellovibrionaceae bacterium]
MIKQNVIANTALNSPIANASFLNPQGKKWKKSLAADLLLTALIDAFSILVIFLLMNFSSNGEILFMKKDMELPKAALGDVLERNPVIKVEDGKVFLEEKMLTAEGLIAELLELRKNFKATHPAGEEMPNTITVQADRRTKYEALNQIVLACAHAGFSDLKFAVIMK